ncbi:MAG: hypothetical protein HKN68_00045 [Saprospiraceae bacterium]|nr:hypothetical protein [Saprospiraceae bacterium]
MKNHTQLTIAIIISLLALPFISYAQNESTSPSGYFWVGADFSGVSEVRVRRHHLTGKSINLNLNYNKGIHLFSFQVGSSNYEEKNNWNDLFKFFGGGSGRVITDQLINSSFTQVNLMYGLISSPSTVRFFASTGLSWVNANDSNSSAFKDKTEYSGIGLPIKVGTILSFGNIGLGLNYFNNLNSYSNNSGVSFSFIIGVMK